MIKGVSKSVHHKVVIKDLTISIPSGRIVGLLGNNGIGKTTLLRLLGNMQLPDEGEIRIENKPVSAAVAKNIVYLLAPDHLFEWMRVKDAIAFQKDFFPTSTRRRRTGSVTRSELSQRSESIECPKEIRRESVLSWLSPEMRSST